MRNMTVTIIVALVSAVATGTIAHLFTRHRDRKKEEAEAQKTKELENRERVGLLKLIHSEVTNNLEYLKEMGGNRSAASFNVDSLRSEAWEQSRDKLAVL